MQRPTILVTGATGKTGGAVVRQLRALDWPVRAVVRKRDARADQLDRIGAETVVADLYDPARMLAAMRGVTRAYYCPPIQPFMIQGAAVFAVAAREAGLEHVAVLSQWLASPAHPSLMTRQQWLVDNLLPMIPGVGVTVLNPGYFADNYLRLLGFAAHLGLHPRLSRGDSRNAPASNEDIARVAVAVLTDPARHAGRSYRPTGPALLSIDEMIATMGRVLGRTVRPMPMPLWMLTRAARMQGSNAYEIASLRYYIEDHSQGAFAWGAPTSDVLDVTGQPAESFETTVRRYAARPENRRNLANTAKAVFDFMRTPLSPGFDIAGLERRLGMAMPPAPLFAMQDESWKAGRLAQVARPVAVERLRVAAVA